LTDIGFIGFSWIKGTALFNGFGPRLLSGWLMIVEPQSTSGTKIYRAETLRINWFGGFWFRSRFYRSFFII